MILYDWLGVAAIITFVVCSGLLYETLTRRCPHPDVTRSSSPLPPRASPLVPPGSSS
jgi:hypothetical protein